MTAPAGRTRAQTRADDERRRAARTAEIAERHEQWVEDQPLLRAFHLRMATLHRQVQRQHLAAAAIHAAHADRLRLDAHRWHRVRPRLFVAGGDQSRAARPPGRRQGPPPVQLRHRRERTLRIDRGSPRELRIGVGVTPPSRGFPEPTIQAHESLLALVTSLEGHLDVGGHLSGFVAECVALLDVTAAALLLTDHRAELHVAAWSSEPVKLFTGAELVRGAGPSVECHRTGGEGAYPTPAALSVRWPQLAGTANVAEIAAVYAVPLRHRAAAIGVLTLIDSRPGQLRDDKRQLARLLTTAASIGLANQRTIDQHERTSAQLQSALNSRVAIEQAKGMLAERLGIPVDAAFDLLRAHARAGNRNLHSVAAEVIDHSLEIIQRRSDQAAPIPRRPSA